MKHGKKFTMPALLAGLWTLLAMIEALENYSIQEIYDFAKLCLPCPKARSP